MSIKGTMMRLVGLARDNQKFMGLAAPLLNLLAVLVFGFALVGWRIAAGITAAFLLILLPTKLTPLRWPRAISGTGEHILSRAILLGALAASLGSADVLQILTLTLAALALAGEPLLERMQTFTVGTAVNLPGFREPLSSKFPSGLLPWASWLGLLASAASVWVGVPWSASLAIVAAWLLFELSDAVLRMLRVLRSGAEHARLAKALTGYGPVFAIHWAGNPSVSYQIDMWLPYLEMLGRPFVLVARTPDGLEGATRATSRPVLLCRTRYELDRVLVPSLKTVFYVNNASENIEMVRYSSLKHVMLNHGDSEKSFSYNPASRMFDRNFVAGQAGIDRFRAHGVEVHDEQFEIVGRPQMAEVRPAARPVAELDRPTVMYAPTWRGMNADTYYSSLPWGKQIVQALLDRGCNVLFRPHPFAHRNTEYRTLMRDIRQLLAQDSTTGARHVYGDKAERELGVVECFNLSDALICDVSSVANDFLQSGKPLAVPIVNWAAAASISASPLADASYLWSPQPQESTGLDLILDLDELLTELLSTDPLSGARAEIRTHFLGDPGDEPYLDLFLNAANRVL